MTNILREEAMKQYGKLEYPVTHEELYCAGFEAGAKYVYSILREEELKEVDRVMNKALDALIYWKPGIEEE